MNRTDIVVVVAADADAVAADVGSSSCNYHRSCPCHLKHMDTAGTE